MLNEISPGCSLEGLMLKLKLQYFGHLMWRADSLQKTLMLGKIEGRRRRGRQRMRWWMASLTQWTWVWVNSGSWWWTGRPGMLQSVGSQRVGHDWATELNWTEPGPFLGDETALIKHARAAISLPRINVDLACLFAQFLTFRGHLTQVCFLRSPLWRRQGQLLVPRLVPGSKVFPTFQRKCLTDLGADSDKEYLKALRGHGFGPSFGMKLESE